MAKQTFEFIAFGPWVYKIAGKHTIPRLYQKYDEIITKSLLAIKIPRKIERRYANQDMNLYDMVIGIYSDYMLILKRDKDSVIEELIQYSDITYAKRTECLLLGHLILGTGTGEVVIDYNTVSYQIIVELLTLLRSLLPIREEESYSREISLPEDGVDILFENLYLEIKRDEPETILIACQSPFTIRRRKTLLELVTCTGSRTRDIDGSMYFQNKKELIIIDRSSQIEKNIDGGVKFTYTYTYIPLISIKDITTEESPTPVTPGYLCISLVHGMLKFPVNTTENPIHITTGRLNAT